MKQIIGLNGYAKSGKSTAARFLIEEHGFVLVKFAGPLKAMMRALGLGDAEIEGDLKEQPSRLLGGRSPRYAMQTLGSQWGRDCMGADFWVNAAMELAADVLDHGGRVVLDDVRFENEIAAIRSFGGITLRITRPGIGPANSHASEHQPLDVDGEIINCGSIDDLTASTLRAIREMGWTAEQS